MPIELVLLERNTMIHFNLHSRVICHLPEKKRNCLIKSSNHGLYHKEPTSRENINDPLYLCIKHQKFKRDMYLENKTKHKTKRTFSP